MWVAGPLRWPLTRSLSECTPGGCPAPCRPRGPCCRQPGAGGGSCAGTAQRPARPARPAWPASRSAPPRPPASASGPCPAAAARCRSLVQHTRASGHALVMRIPYAQRPVCVQSCTPGLGSSGTCATQDCSASTAPWKHPPHRQAALRFQPSPPASSAPQRPAARLSIYTATVRAPASAESPGP